MWKSELSEKVERLIELIQSTGCGEIRIIVSGRAAGPDGEVKKSVKI